MNIEEASKVHLSAIPVVEVTSYIICNSRISQQVKWLFRSKRTGSNIASASDDSELRHVKKDKKRMARLGRLEVHVLRSGLAAEAEDGWQRTTLHKKKVPNAVHEKASKGQAKTHAIL